MSGTLVFALVLAAAAAASSVAPVAADLDLVLLHTNDMHSRFDETDVYCNECRENDAELGHCYGGFARIAQVVEDERKKAADRNVSSLFMVAGDTFQGTPYFSFFKWKPCVEFINQLQPDIMTLGNHEFDDGIDSLVSYLDGIKHIPTVVSNLNLTREPNLDKFILTSYIFKKNNTQVGIVGYLTTDTPIIAKTGAVEFLDEIESLKKETKKLRESGVNIIIGLGHSGIEIDKMIAKEVDDIDLIVGGHSHTFLYSGKPPSIEKPYGTYPLYVTNAKNKSVPILQAYANTKYIGKVDLHFNSNGDLVTINGSPILLNHDIKQNASMMTVVNKWKPSVINITKVIIGRTAVDLVNNCHHMECNIGNLIADAFVYYNILTRNTYNGSWTDAPIAVVQAGSIRTTLNETDHDGYISLGQLINVTPFANTLVKITISGSSLIEALEHSVSDLGLNLGGRFLLQVSGIKVEYDLTKSPGHRISSLNIRCANCVVPKFEPILKTANYTLLTNNYLAEGGDFFQSFTKVVKKNELIDTTDYNATATYINSISPVMIGIENRITFKNSNESNTSGAISIRSYKLLLFTVSIFTYLNFLNGV